MFNYEDFFMGDSDQEKTNEPTKPLKFKAGKQPEKESFGFDFNEELRNNEKEINKKENLSREEKEKLSETRKFLQEQSIKKIYKNISKKNYKEKKKEKVSNVRRLNKQNLKHKYQDKFLGKTNSYKTRYFSNGFSKSLYLKKYKTQQDKLDKQADYGINVLELNKQNSLGRESYVIIKLFTSFVIVLGISLSKIL